MIKCINIIISYFVSEKIASKDMFNQALFINKKKKKKISGCK
jgi:hypothetical protein